ncbi:MAG: GntP family permease [Syntrophothermus sp.]
MPTFTPEQLAQMVQGPMLVVILLVAIAFIILATARLKIHAFLALLITAYGVALAAKMPVLEIAKVIAAGFGGTLTAIGLVIIAGTIIGTFLERSGAALKMAETVLRVVGEKRPALAMSIIGYIVSIPVFCDSGFVILSSLNKALSKKTKVSMATMAIALSTGLYATHTLVPPTPGPIAAAGNLNIANLGLVILVGLIVAIPATIAGYLWAVKYAGKFKVEPETSVSYDELVKQHGKLPGAWRSFAPILVPILLIALSSIANFPSNPFGAGAVKTILSFLGTPVTALLIGVALALFLVPKVTEEVLSGWVGAALKDAAVILIITGAGGALGAVLKATPMGAYIGETLKNYQVGILLPFIIAAALKTAQGSSTVSLVTTSAIVAPLLPALGLDGELARVLVVMAIGAGAMTVSHANDSYFWVVSQFSNIDVSTAYKTQTTATLVQGLVTIATVALLVAVLV